MTSVCLDTLYIPGPITSSLYKAEMNVNSDGTIESTTAVTFRGGVDVLL
jgi:hypothetical protein